MSYMNAFIDHTHINRDRTGAKMLYNYTDLGIIDITGQGFHLCSLIVHGLIKPSNDSTSKNTAHINTLT